jgi:hypothetical protein
MARVWEITTDPAWIDPIVLNAAMLGDIFKCNQAAVQAGREELTYPSTVQVGSYMESPVHDVVICHDGTELEGYLVSQIMPSGAWGLWVGVFRQAGQIAPIYRGLLDIPVATYGWIRGRITNDDLRKWLEQNIPGTIDPSDPQIIQYGNVPAVLSG